MREIGQLENIETAAVFSDYLYAQGIENEVDHDESGLSHIWIHDEDQIEASIQIFEEYLLNPGDPRYAAAAAAAQSLHEAEAKELKQAEKLMFDRDRLWPGGVLGGIGHLTAALIIISILVGLVSGLGRNTGNVGFLFITNISYEGDYMSWIKGLQEIRHGQVWRLITPIFLHFGIMHILFNMLWLRDLGSMVERRKGPIFLALFILITATLSNLAQYTVSGPSFGGMSGIVYALLGYVWMKGKFEPQSGLYLHPTTVKFMIIWFFLCLSGMIGGVANTVHGVGLGVGVAWGYLSSLKYR